VPNILALELEHFPAWRRPTLSEWEWTMLKMTTIITLAVAGLTTIAATQVPALAAPKGEAIADRGIKNSIGDPRIKPHQAVAKYRFCRPPKVLISGKCDCPQDRCYTSGPCGPSYWMNKKRRPC